MDISFYHLTRSTLEQALPDLLEKTLQRGWRALVKTSSKERAEALAEYLWTGRRDSFLPHGTEKDGFAHLQPIWITDQDENPNAAQILFLTDGASFAPEALEKTGEKTGVFAVLTRICLVFDGENPEALAQARAAWKHYKDQGHALVYWQQGPEGWAQKSS